MEDIFKLKPKDLSILFEQTALKRGLSSALIVEKDYWLVWILQILYSDAEFAQHNAFKGGTSLSKGFQLISRFSEDVDITISRKLLGFNESLEEVKLLSNSKQKRYFESLSGVTIQYIETLSQQLSDKIKLLIFSKDFNLYVDENDQQRIIFEYPKLLDSIIYPSSNYILPRIILEFGSRGDTSPTTSKYLQTYIEQTFETITNPNPVNIQLLDPRRTFWEKVTALHMLAHQPEEKTFKPFMARHYYDTHMVAKSEIGKQALNDTSLLRTVAAHKHTYFRSRQASYETAKPGTLKLIPSKKHLADLKQDYQSMQNMFFTKPIIFDELIQNLQDLENQLNTIETFTEAET